MIANYQQTVTDNLQAMGTPAQEWRAVPVKRMVATTREGAKPVTMPEFDFPQGYGIAPSIFREHDNCCQLCGHDIKNVYWLQNDVKRWTLAVGCECVTHFAGGDNGAQAARKSVAASNRELLAQYEQLKRDYYAAHSAEVAIYGYTPQGRVQTSNRRVWKGEYGAFSAVRIDYEHYKRLLGDMTAKDSHYDKLPIYSDRQIANWLKKHGAAMEQLAATMRERLEQQTCES